MARGSRGEACMICERFPCECDGAVQRQTRSRRVVTVEAPVLQDTPELTASPNAGRQSMKDKMRAAATASPREPRRQLTPPPASRRIRHSEDDLILASAIRALEPILHPDEKKNYSMILGTAETLEERVVSWKARHRELTDG